MKKLISFKGSILETRLIDVFEEEHLSSLEYAGLDNSLVVRSDAVNLLKRMKPSSVDLIFTDPPYNLGKDFGLGTDHWDSPTSYISWCKQWIDGCMRVLKPNGVMYFMAATQFMPYLDVYSAENYAVLCRIIWSYDSSGVQSKKMFGSLYEPILMVAHKGKSAKDIVFNSQDILVEAKTGAQRKLIDYRKTPPQPYSTKKIPGNVWDFSRVRFRMEEYEDHPSQKPEALLERIILASSNPGDIVFDPFSGSFTTSAVACRLGRFAIGNDINPDYYKIGLRRTGVATEYHGELLRKNKTRKTSNKSKRDHEESLRCVLSI